MAEFDDSFSEKPIPSVPQRPSRSPGGDSEPILLQAQLSPADANEPYLLVALPSRPPHPGLGWAILWLLGLMLISHIVPMIVAGFYVAVLFLMNGGNIQQLQAPQELTNSKEYAAAMLAALHVSQFLTIGSALLAISLIVGKSWPRILGVRRPSPAQFLLTLLGLPGLMIVSIGVEYLAGQFLPRLVPEGAEEALLGQWAWPMGLLVVGIAPGIGEELWFRGFLGRGLVARYGVIGGVVLTSAMFGILHLDPPRCVTTFVMGLLLHCSYLATRSILVPMILHMGNNSLAILSLHFDSLHFINTPSAEIPWYVYAFGVSLVIVVGWTLYRYRTQPESV